MPTPKVFLSSTYLDLQEVRTKVADYFREHYCCEIKLFERGGVFYDPSKPVFESCCNEVKDCEIFLLIIGSRYGSSASDSKINKNHYNSITKEEYLTARDTNIPIYTFIKKSVHTEFETYRKNPVNIHDSISYAQVDNIQIFKLIEEIYSIKRGGPILFYENASDIIEQVKRQMVGMLTESFRATKKKLSITSNKARINAYKLFFLRDQRNLSFSDLSKLTGVDRNLLRQLEKIDKRKEYLEPKIFQLCDVDIINRIERVFDCYNYLKVGRSDDFLSKYIQYYYIYKGKQKKINNNLTFNLDLNIFPTKAVVFDFDGTLTTNKNDDLTTWEKIWTTLGYNINECSYYHRQFSEKKISHEEWCDITCKNFCDKGLHEQQLFNIAETIKLIPGTKDVLKKLYDHNIKLYICSGSIRQVIKQVLGELYELFDEIKANELIFDKKNGKLVNVRGTDFDFEKKADFIKNIISQNNFYPLEVLFIGNSCNDIWASQSGARTLCVNPTLTDPNNHEYWTYYLRKLDNLNPILDFIHLDQT